MDNLNNPEAGILDNDKNGDGIPDFIIAINQINLKTKLFKTIKDLQEQNNSIKDPGFCFAIAIYEGDDSNNFDITFHYDDTTTSIGRT